MQQISSTAAGLPPRHPTHPAGTTHPAPPAAPRCSFPPSRLATHRCPFGQPPPGLALVAQHPHHFGLVVAAIAASAFAAIRMTPRRGPSAPRLCSGALPAAAAAAAAAVGGTLEPARPAGANPADLAGATLAAPTAAGIGVTVAVVASAGKSIVAVLSSARIRCLPLVRTPRRLPRPAPARFPVLLLHAAVVGIIVCRTIAVTVAAAAAVSVSGFPHVAPSRPLLRPFRTAAAASVTPATRASPPAATVADATLASRRRRHSAAPSGLRPARRAPPR